MAEPPAPGTNPLATDDPLAWERLVEALGPTSMLVAIQGRMSPETRARITPEDLWQDTLLLAWRDRRKFEWRGLTSFRRWLLQLAEHQLQNGLRAERTLRRGGGRTDASVEDSSLDPGDLATPSRIATNAELMRNMATTLASLDDEYREVIRLRLFEGEELEQIACRLGLGISAVRHRFRRGMAVYQQRLRELAGTTWQRADSATPRPAPGA